MKVLVTGASGFVGRWAVDALLRRGAETHAVSRRTRDWPPGTIAHLGDLLDADGAVRLLDAAQPDAILHLAWFVEHGVFWSARENLDWVAATLHLARAAARRGVSRFVGVGTCYEYQWPDDSDCDEVSTPLAPTTLYAVAKDATRRLLAEMDEMSLAWARLFYLYGPFEDERRLVASIASRIARGEAALLTQGRAVRDFLDVRDAGDALAALTLSNVRGPVNVASGIGVSVAQIAGALGAIAGAPQLLSYGALPDRPDEPPRIVAAVRRLQGEVGATAARPLDQGLADAYRWWRERQRA